MTMTVDSHYDTISVHQHYFVDDDGDVIDVVEFCTDWCHQQYARVNELEYDGWNGCHEVQVVHGEETPCAFCGSNMAIV